MMDERQFLHDRGVFDSNGLAKDTLKILWAGEEANVGHSYTITLFTDGTTSAVNKATKFIKECENKLDSYFVIQGIRRLDGIWP